MDRRRTIRNGLGTFCLHELSAGASDLVEEDGLRVLVFQLRDVTQNVLLGDDA